MKVVIKDSHINLDNVDYFAYDSIAVATIGAYGEKRTFEPNPSKHGLNKKGELTSAAFQDRPKIISSHGPYEYAIDNSVKGGFGGAFKADLKVATIDGHVGIDAFAGRQDALRFMCFFVDPDPMATVINNAGKKNHIKDLGGDARVVHRVIIAIDDKLAKYLGGDATFDVKAGAGPIEIEVTIDAKANTKTTLSFSDPTCIGYLLMKVKWNNDRVVETEDDVWSL